MASSNGIPSEAGDNTQPIGWKGHLLEFMQTLTVKPIIIALIVLFLALLVAYAAKKLTLGDTALIAILLLPLLAYGVVSGDIRELTGPGGWGAKFREVAGKMVDPIAISQEATFFQKGSIRELTEFAEKLEIGKPIALTLTLGKGGFYEPIIIGKHIQVLSGYDPDMSVIILDTDARFFAVATGKYVLNILNGEEEIEYREKFMTALRSDDGREFDKLQGVLNISIRSDESNSSALQKMQEKNTSRLVVVSSENRPIGLLLRDRIVTQLLVKLSQEK